MIILTVKGNPNRELSCTMFILLLFFFYSERIPRFFVVVDVLRVPHIVICKARMLF